MSALDKQVGGNHYKGLAIQPVEYAMANKLDGCQFEIVKYVTRFREKNGIQDLEKAKHYIDLLIGFENRKAKGSNETIDDVLASALKTSVPKIPESPAEALRDAFSKKVAAQRDLNEFVRNTLDGKAWKGAEPGPSNFADGILGASKNLGRPSASDHCDCPGCTLRRLVTGAKKGDPMPQPQTEGKTLDEIEAMFPGAKIVIVTAMPDDGSETRH